MKFIIALSVLLIAVAASAHAGELLVADEGADTVGQYDSTTGATINASFISGIGNEGPRDIKASGADLYITTDEGPVGQYNATSGALINASFQSEPSESTAIAFSGSNYYVTGDMSAYVNGYSSSGPLFSETPSGVEGAWGVAVLGNILYVSVVGTYMAGHGSVAEYNATTGALINPNFITGLTVPEGLTLVGNHLYVVSNASNTFPNQNTGSIGEYDATTGAAINASLVTGLYAPVAATVVGNNLYVTSNPDVRGQPGYPTATGVVGEYNATTGSPINASFITGFSDPQGIIYLAPEPATWVLLAIGMAALLARGLIRPRRAINS